MKHRADSDPGQRRPHRLSRTALGVLAASALGIGVDVSGVANVHVPKVQARYQIYLPEIPQPDAIQGTPDEVLDDMQAAMNILGGDARLVAILGGKHQEQTSKGVTTLKFTVNGTFNDQGTQYQIKFTEPADQQLSPLATDKPVADGTTFQITGFNHGNTSTPAYRFSLDKEHGQYTMHVTDHVENVASISYIGTTMVNSSMQEIFMGANMQTWYAFASEAQELLPLGLGEPGPVSEVM